jgi:sulfate permease, SulP family
MSSTAPHDPGMISGLPEQPFTPKLVSMLREGYGLADFRADLIAGLTVSIVALPLSMALAIASGATPASGLYAAIIGGFLVSLLGGSRFQIGGPAGAFIVLVSAVIGRHGFDGLLLATMMAGAIMVVFGLLRLGSLIRHIPHAVLAGFTAGIAVIIFASQIKDLIGLTLAGKEPSALLPKLAALATALPSISPAALAISATAILTILVLKQLRPNWPVLLIGVGIATLLSALFHLPVETIGTRFGGIPSSLPWPALPGITTARLWTILPDALAIAALAGIESLLSAAVADGMSGRQHRPNIELVAQGLANIGTALFGGICVTGTIARTATNVRAGAKGPVAGMAAALILLLFMLVAAPLASYIPLAALAGLLAVVSWNMVERGAIRQILRHSRLQTIVLSVTFLLVVFVDLMAGIGVGTLLGLVFMRFGREAAH